MATRYSLVEWHPIGEWAQFRNLILKAICARARSEAEAGGYPPPPSDRCDASLWRHRTDQDPEDAPLLIPDAVNPDIVELRIEWRAT